MATEQRHDPRYPLEIKGAVKLDDHLLKVITHNFSQTGISLEMEGDNLPNLEKGDIVTLSIPAQQKEGNDVEIKAEVQWHTINAQGILSLGLHFL